jgi:hypothetical protein
VGGCRGGVSPGRRRAQPQVRNRPSRRLDVSIGGARRGSVVGEGATDRDARLRRPRREALAAQSEACVELTHSTAFPHCQVPCT